MGCKGRIFMDRFIGRVQEIQTLQAQLEQNSSTISVIYGRRRVGKSALIRQAFQDCNTLYFEGLENQSKSKQIANFTSQLTFQLREGLEEKEPKSWREALMNLAEAVRGQSIVLVFDEFQWMANYRSEIVSDLKMVWEQHLSRNSKVALILCGSIASFMITKVLKSSALYGRSDLVIHLKPFNLHETSECLTSRGVEEILESHILVGGVPKYIELLSREPSLYLGMQNLAFTPTGYFVEEYDRIFISHFGKNPDYNKIIGALAKHPYGLTRSHISKMGHIGLGGGLSKQLFDLESAGFISSYWPFHRRSNTKEIKYVLKDPYLRFYFAYILPNLRKIQEEIEDIFLRLMQQTGYQTWLGRGFEYLCMDHAKKISQILGFSGIDYSYGPFFKRGEGTSKGVQVDLIFDRSDKVITVCEMKYTKQAPGLEIIEEMEKKISVLKEVSHKTMQRVLITKTPPSKQLIRRAYFYKIIQAEALI
jgi:uncharacterized protein